MSGSFARTNLPQPLVSASYDAANELTGWGGSNLTYDANGNMLADGTHSFTWDARDQAASINGVNLQYDALGRRIQNLLGTSFLYDGTNVVQELSGTTVTANLLNGGIDEIFSRTDSTGAFAQLRDVLGSTLALTDATGNIQTAYSYDAFGNTSIAGSTSSNVFQYTGREDESNGLYYYRARYYNPLLGRFISQDPLGFGSGGSNLYAYVGDDPTNLIDPFGLDAIAAPGFWESLIPVWGSGRQAIHDFQCGNWGWGLFNTGLAITDVFLVKSLVTALGKVGAKTGAKVAGKEWSHWIPDRLKQARGGWIPDSIVDSGLNGQYVTAEEHALNDPFRYRFQDPAWKAANPLSPAWLRQWNRAPIWARQVWKLGGVTGGGAAVNAGRNCGC